MASSNVVGAVTAHIAGLNAASFKARYGAGVTPNTLGMAVANCTAKQCSPLRQAVGRNGGYRASQFGGRWPQFTYAQWCTLLAVAPKVAALDPTAHKRAGAVMRTASGGKVAAPLFARKLASAGKPRKPKVAAPAAPDATAHTAPTT